MIFRNACTLKASYSRESARLWDKVPPVDMPNLTGVGHRIAYVDNYDKVREPLRLNTSIESYTAARLNTSSTSSSILSSITKQSSSTTTRSSSNRRRHSELSAANQQRPSPEAMPPTSVTPPTPVDKGTPRPSTPQRRQRPASPRKSPPKTTRTPSRSPSRSKNKVSPRKAATQTVTRRTASSISSSRNQTTPHCSFCVVPPPTVAAPRKPTTSNVLAAVVPSSSHENHHEHIPEEDILDVFHNDVQHAEEEYVHNRRTTELWDELSTMRYPMQSQQTSHQKQAFISFKVNAPKSIAKSLHRFIKDKAKSMGRLSPLLSSTPRETPRSPPAGTELRENEDDAGYIGTSSRPARRSRKSPSLNEGRSASVSRKREDEERLESSRTTMTSVQESNFHESLFSSVFDPAFQEEVLVKVFEWTPLFLLLLLLLHCLLPFVTSWSLLQTITHQSSNFFSFSPNSQDNYAAAASDTENTVSNPAITSSSSSPWDEALRDIHSEVLRLQSQSLSVFSSCYLTYQYKSSNLFDSHNTADSQSHPLNSDQSGLRKRQRTEGIRNVANLMNCIVDKLAQDVLASNLLVSQLSTFSVHMEEKVTAIQSKVSSIFSQNEPKKRQENLATLSAGKEARFDSPTGPGGFEKTSEATLSSQVSHRVTSLETEALELRSEFKAYMNSVNKMLDGLNKSLLDLKQVGSEDRISHLEKENAVREKLSEFETLFSQLSEKTSGLKMDEESSKKRLDHVLGEIDDLKKENGNVKIELNLMTEGLSGLDSNLADLLKLLSDSEFEDERLSSKSSDSVNEFNLHGESTAAFKLAQVNKKASALREVLGDRLNNIESFVYKLKDALETNKVYESSFQRLQVGLKDLENDKENMQFKLQELAARLNELTSENADILRKHEEVQSELNGIKVSDQDLRVMTENNRKEAESLTQNLESKLLQLISDSEKQLETRLVQQFLQNIDSAITEFKTKNAEEALKQAQLGESFGQKDEMESWREKLETRMAALEDDVVSVKNCCKKSGTSSEATNFDTSSETENSWNSFDWENGVSSQLLGLFEGKKEKLREFLMLHDRVSAHLSGSNVVLGCNGQSSVTEDGSSLYGNNDYWSYFDSQILNASSPIFKLRALILREVSRLTMEDGTGLPDFALESTGGSVIPCRCSPTFEGGTKVVSVMGFPLWKETPSPRVVIQPDIHPGNCWPFKGSAGRVAIKLAVEIHITSVSYQHIPPSISPSGHLSSAPKSFLVYGLASETDDPGTLLGSFVYDIYSENYTPLQTFQISYSDVKSDGKERPRFGMVSFVVNENYGNENFTCLYRFRVHGQL